MRKSNLEINDTGMFTVLLAYDSFNQFNLKVSIRNTTQTYNKLIESSSTYVFGLLQLYIRSKNEAKVD